MCFGQNCARQATQYINAQLAVLYLNAEDCYREHENSRRPEERYRYAHALYDFFHGKVSKRYQTQTGHDARFHALFDKPEIEFICNHDAVLRIHIRSGHYSMDPSDQTNEHKKGDRSDRVEQLKDQHFDYRIGFDIRTATSLDLSIGGGHGVVRMIVLNLTDARLVSVTPAIETKEDVQVLDYYLHQYFDFLQKAGNHILFSLPNFEVTRLPLTIDHSASEITTVRVSELHGVNIEKINAQLQLMWLKAATTAVGDASGQAHITDWRSISIAEYHGSWTFIQSDTRFHLKFGSPYVEALCSREAILHFRLDKLLIYENSQFEANLTHTFEGWTITVMAEIVHEQDVEKRASRFRVDLNQIKTRSELCEYERSEHAATYFSGILEFFFREYLAVLESAGYLVIYDTGRFAAASSVMERFQRDSWEMDSSLEDTTETTIASWKDIISTSDMQGFDQIIALSQGSINSQLRQSHEAAGRSTGWMSWLANWSYKDYFSATFAPMTVQLLSNGRALLWVHLLEGQMRALLDGRPSESGEKYDLENLRVAFEVQLEITDHASMRDIDAGWHSIFSASQAYRTQGRDTNCSFRHVLLNTRSAEFLYEYSHLDDLLHSHGSEIVNKLQAIVYYIRDQYFQAMTHRGLHILYTIPIWARTSMLSCALTEVATQVYSSVVVDRENWMQIQETAEPVLIIRGMTSPAWSTTQLHFTGAWVARVDRGFSHGTICISGQDLNLLTLLARFNSVTTLIPSLSVADTAGGWRLQLTTLAVMGAHKACSWTAQRPQEDACLKYKWDHSVTATYSHGGSCVIDGAWAATCTTRNLVELPTVYRSGTMEVRVWGEIILEVSSKSAFQQISSSAVARWSASIIMQTDSFGVKCNAPGEVPIVFDPVEPSGVGAPAQLPDLPAELKASLPTKLDLKDVIAGLRQFEGPWQTCYPGMHAYTLANPVFNRQGDLLFELRSFGQWNAAPALLARPVNSAMAMKNVEVSVEGASSLSQFKRFGDSSEETPSPIPDSKPSTNGHAEDGVEESSQDAGAAVS